MGSDGHGNLGSPKDKRESFEKIKEEVGVFFVRGGDGPEQEGSTGGVYFYIVSYTAARLESLSNRSLKG